ncbi:ornithine carbamoyltransferase, partial [Candidatus Margulisiibacteriota bacterium]
EHEKITKLAQYADIPVINALTDKLHPCQALSDLFTIKEKKGKLQGLKMAYIGDGNNVCSSLMLAAAKVGMEFMAATPKGYEPKKIVVERAQDIAKKNKAQITIVNDPVDAAVGADIVYTDVWASMGQEKQAKKRKKVFKKFQVNKALMEHVKKGAIVMHCLPAHRGEEISADVIDGKQSIVFDQAENRLHVQKAILTLLLEK